VLSVTQRAGASSLKQEWGLAFPVPMTLTRNVVSSGKEKVLVMSILMVSVKEALNEA
jgi:hypothetical protein